MLSVRRLMSATLIAAALVVLVACGAVPLSEIQLEPLLVQPGDLPAGFSGAQVKSVAPEMFKNFPSPQRAIDQRFEHEGETGGGVVVLLYEQQADRDRAYAMLVDGISDDAQPVADLGEQSIAHGMELEAAGMNIKSTDLGFVRCQAIVHVRLTDTSNVAEAAEYAKRLDKRLSPLVCR